MTRFSVLVLALLATACSGKDAPTESVATEQPPTEPHAEVATAAEPESAPPAAPGIQPYAPMRVMPAQPQPPPLEILLRSTPAGAIAIVDGKELGATPVLWRSRAGTRAKDFTFTLTGYAPAQYRFIPTKSGIVHATLKQLSDAPSSSGDTTDAGGKP